VWEANHVWLIFVIVVLFTCFPAAYGTLARELFVPFHMALLGIMLRGAAFVFRAYADDSDPVRWSLRSPTMWERTFGISSVVAPLVLGAAFGTVTAEPGTGPASLPKWLGPYSLSCGALALSTCAYLAAVYLCVEAAGELREDFRKRAVIAGTSTAALAGATLYLSAFHAEWFFRRMLEARSWPVLGAGLVLFAGSAFAVFTRRYMLARWFAAAQITCLLTGWALAQAPYIVYPHHTLQSSAAPIATIQFLLVSLVPGLAILLPSLYLLFRTFKRSTAS
jgi:cytochrome d ubiquinol oxidase subunit II